MHKCIPLSHESYYKYSVLRDTVRFKTHYTSEIECNYIHVCMSCLQCTNNSHPYSAHINRACNVIKHPKFNYSVFLALSFVCTYSRRQRQVSLCFVYGLLHLPVLLHSTCRLVIDTKQLWLNQRQVISFLIFVIRNN